jgi:hypothetical protein
MAANTTATGKFRFSGESKNIRNDGYSKWHVSGTCGVFRELVAGTPWGDGSQEKFGAKSPAGEVAYD